MLICHCRRVNDRRIRETVEGGARTVGQVGRNCGAGTCCGGCAPAIAELIESQTLETQPPPATRPLPVSDSHPGRVVPLAAE